MTWTPTNDFLDKFLELLKPYIFAAAEQPLVRSVTRDFGVEGLLDKDTKAETLLAEVRDIISHSVNAANPGFFNRLYAGPDASGILGDFLGTTLNASLGSEHMAPVFMKMERQMLRLFFRTIGFDADTATGTFVPGGSIGNLYAIHVARDAACRRQGSDSMELLACFYSERSHYSVERMASMIGVRRQNMFAVEANKDETINVDHLRRQLTAARQRGLTPFFVNCTAGTTVCGSFDDVGAVIDCVADTDVHVHVDASWGGAALLSRESFPGVDLDALARADSVSWCLHKMMGAPLHTALVAFRDGDALKHAFGRAEATYVYQKGHGMYSMQCSRPSTSVLKIWTMVRFNGGLEPFGAKTAKAVRHARAIWDMVNSDEFPGLRPLHTRPPRYSNVCFYHLPAQHRHLYDDGGFEVVDEVLFRPATEEARALVSSHTQTFREKIMDAKRAFIAFASIPSFDVPNFFRMVVINERMSESHLRAVLTEVFK